MGKRIYKLDSYMAQLGRDSSNWKLETFSWANFATMVIINTLLSTDEEEQKLREELNIL